MNGTARCTLHGALGGAPIKTGRYSKVKHKRLGTLIERHGEDENPLDLLPDLALLRALTEDYINRYDDITEALLAWHKSNAADKDKHKPPRILDLADSYRLISEITKIAKRIEDVKANNAISQKDFFRLIEQMAIAVRTYVKDDEIREKIAESWNSMKY
jgi:hypothetical protein